MEQIAIAMEIGELNILMVASFLRCHIICNSHSKLYNIKNIDQVKGTNQIVFYNKNE